ncbi:serine O-acetyltransferase [Alteromonas gilva]|uniref:Serine O-acetyltransferase n=1 Tax=Alteromonas gilva TaxID=2987522 RepID=A0ABT5KZE0_9ALTE|nr:serine O-acetyltransferase [Alteromonas gilva]MDC8829554.1 serine O-acetyltransferase [Alteromonas gilva]
MKESDNNFDGGFYNAITFQKISRYFYLRKMKIIARLFNFLTHFLFSSTIPSSVEIGEGTYCSHRGIAVVIHKNSKIGKNCIIGTSVVLGGRHSENPGGPVIGDNVYIGTGAKILGPIKIGDNSNIGANSVVLKDVPANSTVVGIPGKVI